MFRSFITIAAVAGLVAGASAQQQMPAGSLQPVSNVQTGSYDFDNGFTATTGGNRAIGPDTLFDTNPNFAYYYSGTGIDTQEWLDEVQLPNRGLSGEEQITGFSWSYCEASGIAYFDSNINLYNDTVAFVGPAVWVPGSATFPDCVYGITGLPGLGCWWVTVDLSCGFECTLPDASNPLSGAQGTIGWSVVCRSGVNAFVGPILGRAADATPGSQDLFEWRDNNGGYFGMGAYYQAGTYWFGGNPHARADFLVGFFGASIDIQNCYGNKPLDTICLEATKAMENGSAWTFQATGVAAAAQRAFLMIQVDAPGTDPGCDQAVTNGSGGQFTRQMAVNALPVLLGTVTGNFSGSLGVPFNPNNAHVILQCLTFATSGPIKPGKVQQASNGIDTTL